jgi:hypothetical protein
VKRKIFAILSALIISLGLIMAMPVSAAVSATFFPTSGPANTSITVYGTGWAASEAISSVTVGGVAADCYLKVDDHVILSGDLFEKCYDNMKSTYGK